MSKTISEKMQDELSSKINGAFDAVIEQKNNYYQNNPDKIPSKSAIDSLIRSSSITNAAISGGSSLIPGPWGMAAVVPELVLVIRNQIALIYDIAAAYGKKDIMTKELSASIFLYSMGTTAGSLLVVHGGKYFVKRASLQVFQKMIVLLGGKITQQALKSAISKWLPGVGAAAMAAWTNYSTRQIGNKAKEILQKDIVIDDGLIDVQLVAPVEDSVVAKTIDEQNIDFLKIQALIALSKIDGHMDDIEAEFIAKIIDKSDLSADERVELIGMLALDKVKVEGLDFIKKSPDDAIALLADLTALAKVNDQFHITEKMLIKQIGKALGFSENDIDEVMEG